MNALLVVNPRSGQGETHTEELVAAAEALGIGIRLLGGGDDPAEIARGSSADVLGMAGGDGSLAPVAEVALEREAAFVCILYGTRNHFARDIGLDRDDPLTTRRRKAPRVRRRRRTGRRPLRRRCGRRRARGRSGRGADALRTAIEFRVEPRALRVLVPDGGG